MAGRKSGASVFELANRIAINSDINRMAGVEDSLADHRSGLNNDAHQINNISGLQTALNGKQDVISGYTGTIDIVVSVDFANKISSTAQINVLNGIIISIN